MLSKEELMEVVRIGIDLTTEKDKNRLLEKMLVKGMDISGCDAGTLYLYKNDALEFKIMKTLSQGVSTGEHGEVIELPPVPLREGNVCAYSAIHRELINIPDVYNSDRFDFSGPKKYDAITGYRTGSMIVIPMEDAEGELVGVLQLINKLAPNGKDFITFNEDDEFALRSMGSMTAVSLSGMIYIEEIRDQLQSFVQAFATAVDARTPYNGSHTRKVTAYSSILAEYMNRLHEDGSCEDYFDNNRLDCLRLSAALHDIGKMIVPLNVMNKATRLDERIDKVEDRFELFHVLYERDMLAGRITPEENEAKQQYLSNALTTILECNGAGFLPDDKIAALDDIAAQDYIDPDGLPRPYLTEEEHKCLTIRKGTLTEEERLIMESHVVMTRKILAQVHFSKRYEKIPLFAAQHHETLNGTGYPDRLTAEDLPLESRILAVADIYDALTSSDRPYKRPIPQDKAFGILHSMVEEGRLEGRLVEYLEQALVGMTAEDIAKKEL